MIVRPSILRIVAGVLLIMSQLIGCSTNNSASVDNSIHSESAVQIKTISDPQAYATTYFQQTYGPVELVAYHDDLNADGRPDLLIANLASAGQAGMAHLIFIHTDSGYQFSGELFMPRHGYRVLTPAEDGRPRLVYSSVMGAGQRTIVWVVAMRGEFIVENQEIVDTGDSGNEAGRRRWAEVFGP